MFCTVCFSRCKSTERMTLCSLDALDGNDSPGFSESDDDFSAEEEYISLTLKHQDH